MNRYSYVNGNQSDRGPEALILDGVQVVGIVSMAVAGRVVAALNRSETPLSGADQVRRLHDVVVEQHRMLAQMIESREGDGFTAKESDDSKRARQLLDRAGRIAQVV